MPARIPTLNKSPFAFDSRSLEEMGSAHAGLLGTSRAIRSLGLAGLVEANIKLTIALLAYNVASTIKSLCLSPEERTARFKRYRLLLIEVAGRMSRFQCKLRLRLRANGKTIQRFERVWKIFELPTQATAFS